MHPHIVHGWRQCRSKVAEKAVEVVQPSFSVESFSTAQLAESPILLLVFYHRALRAELAELYHAAEALVESVVEASRLGMLVELKERFEFLKIAYKYHCAAEDEVIFLALNRHVENIAPAYSLEHRSIDDLINSIVRSFDVLMEGGVSDSKLLQELMFCIGTLQTIMCKHMVKEEKQVFPLLKKLFSQEEQASLMWNFLCSVPLMFLRGLLPWMISPLSPDERQQIANCVKDIVPKHKLLHKVVVSCFEYLDQSMSNETEVRARVPLGHGIMRNVLQIHASDSISEYSLQPKKECFNKYIQCSPVDAVHVWHLAIWKDLETTLEELNHVQSSQSFSNLSSIILHLKFLADVLSFYCHSLDQLVIPLLKEFDESCDLSVMAQLPYRRQLENMQRVLQYNATNDVTKLCREVKALLMVIGQFFTFQESKVFETIKNKCSHDMQRELLYASIQVLPLGLLRCVITWFSPHLSDKNSKPILATLKQGSFRYQDHFTSLLHEWFHVSFSNETHISKFRGFLQDVYGRRSFLCSEKVEEHNKCIKLASYCKEPKARLSDAEFSIQMRKSLTCSSSSIISTVNRVGLPYSREINLHILFPLTVNRPIFSQLSGEKSDYCSDVRRSRPIDLVFFFHRAFEKDLKDLVNCSNRLIEDVQFLKDFHERFQLIKHLYQIHSNAEDEIAFPALEEKGKVQNISHSYVIDHKMEVEHFNNISIILDKMSELQVSSHTSDSRTVQRTCHQLCTKLQDMCRSMHKILSDHIHHEQIELWSLFRESFSTEEQEKVIGSMLGRIKAEILQVMIPWLMLSLTPEEKHAAMSIWRQVTKKTMFDEWLGEWWEVDEAVELIKPDACTSKTVDPFEIMSTYLSKEICKDPQEKIHCEKDIKFNQHKSSTETKEASKEISGDCTAKILKGDKCWEDSSKYIKLINDMHLENNEDSHEAKAARSVQVCQESSYRAHLGAISQEELEAAIRRVSRDSSLDSQKKSHIIQNLMMSRWIVANQKTDSGIGDSPDTEEIPGRCPSYRDPEKQIYGCKHYTRNCKLLASCCNQLYPCRRCHDEMTDHSVDRKAITKMMCMKCLMIQPIGPTCTSPSCNNWSMAHYYCKICRIYDDEREIYHCPYCNLCRVGKGLGVDYFHCMNCNACMSRSLTVHICREKCFEGNCPICHEYIFTSSMPVKALPCGHLMHSACFQDYTCSHYTCPICSKSLGDMRVYFQMLDALLAEETIPDEYAGKTQDILCNDCEKRGIAPFHWLYHKCSFCGSYNTRLL